MAKAAIQGMNSVEYIAALLKHSGKITDLVMQQAMRNMAKGVQVLELLLEHGANATEASMKFAAGHELMGLEYVRIFIEYGARINDHILQTAMRNCTHGVGILRLLLRHGASVTEAFMEFAAGLELIDEVDTKIFEEHGHKRNFEPVASNRRREINLFKFLLKHRRDSTKNLLKATAAKKLPSPEYLKLLIEHGGIPSDPVMIAAADNEKCGPQCCEILLSHGGQITDEIMVSAVFNEIFPIQFLKLFVAHGAKVNMCILELAEIPRSDGNPEIYNFLAHALMVQRFLRLPFDLAEGRKVRKYHEHIVARDSQAACIVQHI